MSQAVIVDQRIIDGQPVRAVAYLEPEESWDSGFMLFAGEPNEQHETALVCLHCIIDEHPELGRGLELAHEHGEAIRNGSIWTASMSVGPRRTG